MIDWERRKKSEKWVKEKSDEFIKTEADCSLTFAEWCYRQGKADRIDECIALFREWQPRLATNVAEFGDMLQQLKENNNGK